MAEQRGRFGQQDGKEKSRESLFSRRDTPSPFRQSRERVDAVNKFSDTSRKTWYKFEEIDTFIDQNRKNLENQQFFQNFQENVIKDKEHFETIWNEIDDAEAKGGLAGGLTIVPLKERISKIEALGKSLEARLELLTEAQKSQKTISSAKAHKEMKQEILTTVEQHPHVQNFLNSLQKTSNDFTKAKQDLVKSELDSAVLSEQARHLKDAHRLLHDMHENLDKFLDAQLKLAREGSEKLQEIRNTRPENVDEYNAECKKKYNERYYTLVFPSEDEQKNVIKDHWDIYTGIQGKESCACYQAQLVFEEGKIENITFREKYSYKKRPVYDQYSEEFFPRENGHFDEEVEYRETKPQNHDKIIFNMIEFALDDIDKINLLPGDRAKFASEQLKIESEDSIDAGAIEIMDNAIYQDNEKVIYQPESLQFKTMVKANTGWGKFYLAEHHYTNKEVKTIELERKRQEDQQDDDEDRAKYHSTFIIRNKDQ